MSSSNLQPTSASMLSTMSTTAVRLGTGNHPVINYRDDDDYNEEDDEDTCDVDGSNSAYSATAIRKIGTTLNLGKILSDDVNSPRNERKFGEDLSNMVSSSKMRPAKKLDSSSLSIVAGISLDNNSLVELPPSKQPRPSLQQLTLPFPKAPPSEQPSKLFSKVPPSVQSSTSL